VNGEHSNEVVVAVAHLCGIDHEHAQQVEAVFRGIERAAARGDWELIAKLGAVVEACRVLDEAGELERRVIGREGSNAPIGQLRLPSR